MKHVSHVLLRDPKYLVISELKLSFQTNTAHLAQAITLEKAIFGELRAKASLASFLAGIRSSLIVVLSTYDGDERVSISWPEMMSYVAGYKNPLVTLELLPTKIEATELAITRFLEDFDTSTSVDVRALCLPTLVAGR